MKQFAWLPLFVIATIGMASLPTHVVYAGVGPRVDTNYRFSASGPFDSLEIFFTWENAPQTGYIYPAFFFPFQQLADPYPGSTGHAFGYMGTQLVGTTKKAIFSIWDTEQDSGTAQPSALTPWCDRFGGEGTGAHCVPDFPWIQGRMYRLQVRPYGRDTTGELWIGTIYDTATQLETTIGIIHVKTTDSFIGYGKLLGDTDTFLEYFYPDTCDNQPYARVLWKGPFANSGQYIAIKAIANHNECTAINTTTPGRPFVIQEGGSGVQRTTPYGTILWQPQLFLPVIQT